MTELAEGNRLDPPHLMPQFVPHLALAGVPEWPARLVQADRGVLHLSLGQQVNHVGIP